MSAPDRVDRIALPAAILAARAAGDVLRHGFGQPLGRVETKAHRHDPVTVFDREADRVIADVLLDALPEVALLSEERAPHAADAELTWVVDPLDGTNNFVRGLPDFAVSIGLVDADGPRVACVFDPMREELFTAVRGEGARLNDRPLHVSAQASLDGASLGIGLSNETARRLTTLAKLPALAPHARALRIVGSAALDLAYVAAGRFDATWYLSLHAWDIAAGRLLVTEAGGRVTDLRGGPVRRPEADGVLATNGALHAALLVALPSSPAP